jgi:hypothetical protein
MELIPLRSGISAWNMQTGQLTFNFHKTLESFSTAVVLSALQGGRFPM